MSRLFWRAFNGGELTPEFLGQILDAKFQTGLAMCRNFRVLPHGPVQNRAGFEFVAEVKDSTKFTRLLPFEYSTTQTMVLQVGEHYCRFHSQGLTLLSGTVPYEIDTRPGLTGVSAFNASINYAPGTIVTYSGSYYQCITGFVGPVVSFPAPTNSVYWTPYAASSHWATADLPSLNFVQSADVLTIVNTGYPPLELRRQGSTNWTTNVISFATTLTPPTTIAAVATAGASPGTPTIQEYACTSVPAGNIGESLISASAQCSNNLFDTGAKNTITFVAPADAIRVNVYKRSNGLWGYIGQSNSGNFIDDNITPDISKTPPEGNDPFVGVNNYPGAVTYFDQRRVFAGTINKPQNMWLTRSGTESDMTYSIPVRDADSISFRVVARQANTVRHLVPLTNLLALTSSAEWRVTSINSDAVTPTSIDVKPQSFVGCGPAQPVIVNNNVIFAAARGSHVREMAYQYQAGGYVTGDLSLRAPHLFDGYSITDMALSKAPHPTIWCVRSDGILLGLTYVPEQQIGAWHWHDTDGAFEAICVVAEGVEDVLYAIVRRTINGSTKRYVERMRPRAFATQSDCFFVDAGVTVTNSTASTLVAGLDHLEGKTISLLVDGAEHRQLTVSSGMVTLDYAGTKIQAGLPITADLQTMPLATQEPGAGQGLRKNVNKAFIRVKDSSGLACGPDFSNLVEAKIRTTEPYGTPPTLQNRVIEVVNRAAWTDDGQVCVRTTHPLPLTITSMAIDYALGG